LPSSPPLSLFILQALSLVVNEDQDLGYPEHPPLNNLGNAHTPYHSETDFDHLRLDSPLADKPVDGLIT
jgi:hypothetical protein